MKESGKFPGAKKNKKDDIKEETKEDKKDKIEKEEKESRKLTNENKEVSKKSSEMSEEERKNKIEQLEKQKEETQGFLQKGAIQEEINMLKDNFNGTKEEYREYIAKERERKLEDYKKEKTKKQEQEVEEKTQKEKQLQEDIKNAPSDKLEQYKIIQENNPMLDEYHVGIRSPKDIKTWEEAIKDEESFSWGDYTKEDAIHDLEKGTITIYSSYPIEQGTFVSTSKSQAEEYAGGKGNKVYTKEVPLEEVAWINGDEGQYAKRSKTKVDDNRLNKNAEEGVRKDIKTFLSGKKDYEGSREEFINDLSNNWDIDREIVEDILHEENVKHPRLFKSERGSNTEEHYKEQLKILDNELRKEKTNNIQYNVERAYKNKVDVNEFVLENAKYGINTKDSEKAYENARQKHIESQNKREEMLKKAYKQYIKEHPNSKITFEDFRKW